MQSDYAGKTSRKIILPLVSEFPSNLVSTLRRAFDLDYRCVVLKDACFDRDEEVHRVLVEKIFPAQATVVMVEDFIAGSGNDYHTSGQCWISSKKLMRIELARRLR
jgi:hypothetical protein